MRRWPLSRALRCGLELAEALRYLLLLAIYYFPVPTTTYDLLLKLSTWLLTHTDHYFSYCLLLTTRRCATAMTTPCLASA